MSQTNSSPINVKNGSGTFYIVSKTDPKTEGWRFETVNNPQTKEAIDRYRKDITVEGTVQWVGLNQSKLQGVGITLNMLVKNETENVTYALEFPMLSTKGVKAVDDYFRSVVGPLQNVSKGDKVTMFLNNKNKDKNDRLYKNVIFLDAEGKLIKSNFEFSDVPKWNSEETTDFTGAKTVKYDPTPTNKFYYDIALSVVDKFKKVDSPAETANTDINNTPPQVNTEDPNNLPF